MKRILSIVLILCLLLTMSACGRKKKEEAGLLRIGVLEPLTGKYAAEGMRETLGIQYANNITQTLRLNGKTYHIELTVKDNGSDPQRSAEAAQELVDAGCAVVLGSYGAELSTAASDVFRAAGVAAIAASCDDPAVTRGNDHYFRIGALPEFQGSVLANFAKTRLGVKSVYCLACAGNAEDDALVQAFRRSAEALELKVVTSAFPANNMDFTPYLNAAKEEGVGAIFAPCELRYAQRILEQAAETEEGTPTFLADRRWHDAALLQALEESELTVYASEPYAEGAVSSFDEGFRAWLGESSEALEYNGGSTEIYAETVLGYDAYYTVLSAAEAAGSADKADILAILPRVARDGVAGSFSFDAEGGAQRSGMWVVKAAAKAPDWENAGAVKAG